MAPYVRKITPTKGRAGNTAAVHGTDLRGDPLIVKFGGVPGMGTHNPGNTDRVIETTIPLRNPSDPSPDPNDPNAVAIEVVVGAVVVTGHKFSYNVPSPLPAINSFSAATGTSPSTSEVEPNQRFTITFQGTDFVLAGRRTPQRVYAVGPDPKEVAVGSYTSSTVRATFTGGLSRAGNYRFYVAFSDQAAASIDAPDFVKESTPAPVINSVPGSVEAGSTYWINGAHFTSPSRSVTGVTIGNLASPVLNANETSIQCVAPTPANYPFSGKVKITFADNGQTLTVEADTVTNITGGL